MFLLIKKLFDPGGNPTRDNGTVSGPKSYDCEEDGVVYMHRKEIMGAVTETWQECQKICEKIENCKGFTWHKPTGQIDSRVIKKGCSPFTAYRWKETGHATVSGLKNCSSGVESHNQTGLASLDSNNDGQFLIAM